MRADGSGDAPGGLRRRADGIAVAVVGGGVSGLTAARELALAGARVVLYEERDRLGGRVRRENVADVPLDIGAEAFATRGGAVAELLTELGLDGQIVKPAPLGSWVVADDGAMPLPAAGTVGIPAAPLARDAVRALGIGGSLRAALEPLLPRSVGRGATLARLVRARLGSRVLDRLVRPVVLGVHSADPADLPVEAVPGLAEAFERRGSLISAARELRDSRAAAGGAVAGLRDGMGELVDALADELERLGVEVRTSARVRRVERGEADGIRILAAARSTAGPAADDAETEALADAAILAVPERAARQMLGALDAEPEARIEIVALAIDDPRLDAAPRGTGALVAADAVPRIRAKALTHVTAKWPARAASLGPGRHLLRLSYGRLGSAPETAGLPDEEVLALALRDASRILGMELDPASVRGMLRREWDNGSVRASAATGSERMGLSEPPGVAFAGDWVGGTGLASVIPAARAAARRILRPAPTPAAPAHVPAPHPEGSPR